MNIELWKQTQFKNYEVSNLGKVRNTKTGNVLSGGISKSTGYYKVSLYVDEKVKTIEIHSLVCTAFHGTKPSKGYVVDHIDKNKLNNEASNLHWITYSANVKRANRKKVNQRRLTYTEYVQVQEEYKKNPHKMATIKSWVYNMFGLSFTRCNMAKVINGQTYKSYYKLYQK
ncbi:HNH endonuclease signature motif containing protein [Enterobacter kobei]